MFYIYFCIFEYENICGDALIVGNELITSIFVTMYNTNVYKIGPQDLFTYLP